MGWSKILQLFNFRYLYYLSQVLCLSYLPSLELNLFIQISSECSHTPNLSISPNQIDCVPNIKYAVSKAFGPSGLLMCAFYLRPVVLTPFTAFVCIFVILSLVLYRQTESLVLKLLELKPGKNN